MACTLHFISEATQEKKRIMLQRFESHLRLINKDTNKHEL